MLQRGEFEFELSLGLMSAVVHHSRESWILIVFFVKSRVIAVNTDGSLRWSITIDGYAEGTPQVGVKGDKIYINHNVPNNNNNAPQNTGPNAAANEPDLFGQITIIDDNGGNAVIAATRTPSEKAPFAPLSLGSMRREDDDTVIDVAIWSENWDDGYTERGNIHALFPSERFDALNGIGRGAYELQVISPFGRSAVTRPVISPGLNGLWVGGTASTISGWTRASSPQSVLGGSFVFGPSWEESLLGTERNRTQRE